MSGDPRSEADPRRRSRFRRCLAGAHALPRGGRFLLRHPRLLLLAAAPVVTSGLAALALVGVAIEWLRGLGERWTAGHGLLAALWTILLLLGGLLAGYVLILALLAVTAAPFCGLLAERVIELDGGRRLPPLSVAGFVLEALRGALHAVLRLAAYLAIALPLYLLGLLLPPLSLLGLLLTCFFLAYDSFDYALSTGKRGFVDKWRFVFRHGAESFGLGGAVALLLALPFVNLLVAPVAATGATLLFRELETSADAPAQ